LNFPSSFLNLESPTETLQTARCVNTGQVEMEEFIIKSASRDTMTMFSFLLPQPQQQQQQRHG
jgi:hypothetical protein